MVHQGLASSPADSSHHPSRRNTALIQHKSTSPQFSLIRGIWMSLSSARQQAEDPSQSRRQQRLSTAGSHAALLCRQPCSSAAPRCQPRGLQARTPFSLGFNRGRSKGPSRTAHAASPESWARRCGGSPGCTPATAYGTPGSRAGPQPPAPHRLQPQALLV